MLGLEELKRFKKVTSENVECPVKGCEQIVKRCKRGDKLRNIAFRCPEHKIYISPTTIEYQSELDNMLWKEADDLNLWSSIKTVKREYKRISRERSEDAVTWNVFRFLEKHNMICDFLGKCLNIKSSRPEIVYWSYSQSQDSLWDMLKKARKKFETVPEKGSEPDIIILSEGSIVIIEAKLGNTSRGRTCIKELDKVEHKYMNASQEWWNKVFYSDFRNVVDRDGKKVVEAKYQPCRSWLIGTWMAEQLDSSFNYVSLVRSGHRKDIEKEFTSHLKISNGRNFARVTWEDIYDLIAGDEGSNKDKNTVIRYFRNKSYGYKENRRGDEPEKWELQQAFSIS
jgi:hypothetical protein